jgi:hypothetical protein
MGYMYVTPTSSATEGIFPIAGSADCWLGQAGTGIGFPDTWAFSERKTTASSVAYVIASGISIAARTNNNGSIDEDFLRGFDAVISVVT